jgi:hypothetical protein
MEAKKLILRTFIRPSLDIIPSHNPLTGGGGDAKWHREWL